MRIFAYGRRKKEEYHSIRDTQKTDLPKKFIICIFYAGDNDELYFRDYLSDNPSIAKEYEQLKLSLWHKYEHNRDAYTEAKTKFIKMHTAKCKKSIRESL